MSDWPVTPVLCCSSAEEKNNLEFCGKLNSETGSVYLIPEHSLRAKDGAVLVSCGTTRNELGETKRHTLVHRHAKSSWVWNVLRT